MVSKRQSWERDSAGRGPTQQQLAMERMRAMAGDVRDLPENYKRHPNVCTMDFTNFIKHTCNVEILSNLLNFSFAFFLVSLRVFTYDMHDPSKKTFPFVP